MDRPLEDRPRGQGDDTDAASLAAALACPKATNARFAQPIRTAQHVLTPLPGMEQVLASILGDVEKAQRRVWVETYIYRDDKLGRAFAEALARAAARGVDTKLLYDPLGSQKTQSGYFDELRSRGIDVRPYRPARLIPGPGSTFPRDHSRVIVADDAAFTGGAAWADEWLPKEHGGKGWHDVCVRVEGGCVADFERIFTQRWREALAEVPEPTDLSTDGRYPDLELVADTPDGKTRVLTRHCEAMRRAKQRIWIENAYFFPPRPFLAELYAAAARGVDVQIILTGETDLPIMKRAARAEFRDWIERGITVREFRRCMLHAKFAVIDDDWATVGTFNANPTSPGLANEVNLFVSDRAFVARMAEIFEADRRDTDIVTIAHVDARSLVDKTLDKVANDTIELVDLLTGASRPAEGS